MGTPLNSTQMSLCTAAEDEFSVPVVKVYRAASAERLSQICPPRRGL